MNRLRAAAGWAAEPFPTTRRFVILASLALGLLGAVGIIRAEQALDDVSHERRRAIERAQLTEADVRRIARRVVRLEAPARGTVVREIQRALRLCLRDPRCERAVQRLAVDEISRADPLVTPPGNLDPAGAAPRTRKPQRPNDGAPPDSNPPTGDGRPPSHGPPPPEPVLDVDLSPIGPVELPPVCTDLVRVNCDRN